MKHDSGMAVGDEDRGVVREPVLVVDSEDASRRALQLLLQGCGFDVRAFSSAASAAESAIGQVRIMFVAHRLSDGEGVRLLRRFVERGWRGKAVLIAEASRDELDIDARESGFTAVVKKPLGRLEVLGALAR
jgi:CheY-like chemotaxis protein